MFCGALRTLARVFGMVVLLAMGGCNGGSTDQLPSATFPIVVFSDVHFDPFYDPALCSQLIAADPGKWAGILSGGTQPSTWGSDTNYALLVRTLESVKAQVADGPMVVFTGDVLGHYLAEAFFQCHDKGATPTSDDIAAMKAFTDKTMAFFMQQVRSSLGDVPVVFALGNADSYWGLGPDQEFLSNTAELYYGLLGGMADRPSFITTFTQGGYYAAKLPGTSLTVIGLNTFEFSPAFKDTKYAEVMAQLDWFEQALVAARADGRKVWLLMHVPPGADKYSTAQLLVNGQLTKSPTMMWNDEYQVRFLKILAEHPGVVVQTLTAHTHMDEYRILTATDVADTTPGITPYFGNDPAFKVFTVAKDSLQAVDYTSFNYDLGQPPVRFQAYYTFSAAYGTQGMLGSSLAQLYPELASNAAKHARYSGSYYSGRGNFTATGNELAPITDTTWPVYWCGILHMDASRLAGCINSYRSG